MGKQNFFGSNVVGEPERDTDTSEAAKLEIAMGASIDLENTERQALDVLHSDIGNEHVLYENISSAPRGSSRAVKKEIDDFWKAVYNEVPEKTGTKYTNVSGSHVMFKV